MSSLSIRATAALGLGVLVFCQAQAAATELHVPASYPTIQAAIDAAVAGDEVVIAPGTYTGDGNRDLDYGGKAITVRSTDPNDPNVVAATVINCQGTPTEPHRGFIFQTDEGPASILDGVTVTGGHAVGEDRLGWAGAVFCTGASAPGASPTLIRCRFIDNQCASFGGGVSCDHSSPTVEACTFEGNLGAYGGGLQSFMGSPSLIDCVFHNNVATVAGGAVRINRGGPLIARCLFECNAAPEASGGAIYCKNSNGPSVSNCEFRDNWADGGGAAYIDSNASPTFSDCVLAGNYCTHRGGALKCMKDSAPVFRNMTICGSYSEGLGGAIRSDDCIVVMDNCLIAGNHAGANGGAYNQLRGSAYLTNCTIVGNTASGSAIYIESSTTAQLTNCIVRDNVAAQLQVAGTAVVNYCNITGGWVGTGNIDADPLFVDADGPDDDPNTWEDNDYHLNQDSPCINRGDPNGDYTGQTDIDGDPRVVSLRTDMGSDEYALCRLTVGIVNDGGGVFDADPYAPGYAYESGTVITLNAFSSSGKSFDYWKVYDPNHPDDSNYIVTDSNNPITIVMDADRKVTAVFECGSGAGLMLPMALGVVGICACTRRWRWMA